MIRVIVNGTFDILHPGHVALLDFARSQGDHVTVAIDSDRRVRRLKGPDRPINDQNTRQIMLAALRSVDAVKIFDTDQDLIDIISQADVMVKGSDYRDQPIIGADLCPIVFFDRLHEYSTTTQIQSIRDRR